MYFFCASVLLFHNEKVLSKTSASIFQENLSTDWLCKFKSNFSVEDWQCSPVTINLKDERRVFYSKLIHCLIIIFAGITQLQQITAEDEWCVFPSELIHCLDHQKSFRLSRVMRHSLNFWQMFEIIRLYTIATHIPHTIKRVFEFYLFICIIFFT